MSSSTQIIVYAGAVESQALVAALRALNGVTLRIVVPHAARSFGMIAGAEVRAALPEARDVQGADAVIDALHPFDVKRMSALRSACEAAGVPRLLVRRPPWQPTSDDRWTQVRDLAEAVAHVPPEARVFATTGRAMSDAFAATRAQILLRQLTAHSEPPPCDNVEYLFGAGPFTEAEERDVMTQHRITHCIFRNTGGLAGCTKVWAARAMKLPVLMLLAPDLTGEPVVQSVEAAVQWVQDL